MKRARQASTTTTIVKKKTKAPIKRTSVPRNWFGASNVNKTATGFPQRMRVTHRYVEAVNSNATTGALRQYIFSANGMFDPNVSGTGHQPTFFDAMSAIYNHYTVINSRIKVEFQTYTATNLADNSIVGICQTGTASPAFTIATNLCEQPKCSYKIMDGDPGSNNNVVLYLNYSSWKTFGSSVLSDSEQRGTSASNPTEQNYFDVFFQDSNITKTVSMDFLVTIEYEAIWTEIKENLSN